MPVIVKPLPLSQVLAVLTVHLDPVLLLALLGAVADEPAPGAPQQSAPFRWLWPVIDPTVCTEVYIINLDLSHSVLR